MEENTVLTGFVAAFMLSTGATHRFFVRLRLHRSKRKLLLIAGNALVFCTLITGIILCGEIYYRFVYDTTDSFGLSKTTQRWFQRHVRRNARGFRDSLEYASSIVSGKRRITFLGDSFAAGQGVRNVEDRFVNLLRQQRSDLEVHNMARCAWDTSHELACTRIAKESGYEFDVVILVYCLNDIAEVSMKWHDVLSRIHAFSQTGYLIENSFLANTLYYRLRAANDPDIGDYYQFVSELYDGTSWRHQQLRLNALHDTITRADGKMMVITFPFLHALGEEYRYASVHQQLDDFWKERNVPHLDLLTTFHEKSPAEVIVNCFDAHPNEHANHLAAEAIANFIADLPDSPGRRVSRKSKTR